MQRGRCPYSFTDPPYEGNIFITSTEKSEWRRAQFYRVLRVLRRIDSVAGLRLSRIIDECSTVRKPIAEILAKALLQAFHNVFVSDAPFFTIRWLALWSATDSTSMEIVQTSQSAARIGSSAASLVSVSASSVEGSEPATMPAPANNRARSPSINALRNAT